jgi:hypothetical protein
MGVSSPLSSIRMGLQNDLGGFVRWASLVVLSAFPTRAEAVAAQKQCLTDAPADTVKKLREWEGRGEVIFIPMEHPEPETRGETMWSFGPNQS